MLDHHGPQGSTPAGLGAPSLQRQGPGGLLLALPPAATALGQGAQGPPRKTLGSPWQIGPVSLPHAAVPISTGAPETPIQVCRSVGHLGRACVPMLYKTNYKSKVMGFTKGEKTRCKCRFGSLILVVRSEWTNCNICCSQLLFSSCARINQIQVQTGSSHSCSAEILHFVYNESKCLRRKMEVIQKWCKMRDWLPSIWNFKQQSKTAIK